MMRIAMAAALALVSVPAAAETSVVDFEVAKLVLRDDGQVMASFVDADMPVTEFVVDPEAFPMIRDTLPGDRLVIGYRAGAVPAVATSFSNQRLSVPSPRPAG